MLQAQLDNQALAKLEIVSKAISLADTFEANQMRNYTLRALNDSQIALNDMTDGQRLLFEIDLIQIFHAKGWH